MSTNPSNAIGTNGAYGGRTSVEALNDILNVFTGGGIVRGWECSPSSGMTVALGGVSGYRDVAIAVSPTGTRTTINNRTTSPVNVTLSTAPASNSRIDVIVAYAQNPPQGSSTVVDNPAACGIIPVSGTVSSSPSAPSDSDIRSAITADGATGSTAYYVVLATITVASGVTTITSNYITQGAKATLGGNNIADEAITTAKIDDGAVTSDKIDFTTLTTTLYSGTSGKTGTITLSDAIENYDYFIIKFRREDTTRTMSSLLVHNDKSSVSFTMTTSNISNSFTTYDCTATISGTTFTFVAGGALAANSSGIQGYSSNNEIKILEIIGVVAS